MTILVNKKIILLIMVCIILFCSSCQDGQDCVKHNNIIENNISNTKKCFIDGEWFVYGMDIYVKNIGNSYSKLEMPLKLYNVLQNEEWYCLKKYGNYIVTVKDNYIYLYNTITDEIFAKSHKQERIITLEVREQYLYCITESISTKRRKLIQYNIDEDIFNEVNLCGYQPYQFCLYDDELCVLVYGEEKNGVLVISNENNWFWEDKEEDMCWNSLSIFCQEGIILKKEFRSTARGVEYYYINRQANSIYLPKLSEAIMCCNCCIISDKDNEIIVIDMDTGNISRYDVGNDALYNLAWQGKTEKMNFVGYTFINDVIMGMWENEEKINLFPLNNMM